MTGPDATIGVPRRIAQFLTFERLLCLYAASIPWMPFVNAGSTPINTTYLFGLGLWALLLWRKGADLSVPMTPGLVMGVVVFVWMFVGAASTGSMRTAMVDLLHFANFLLGYALILAAVRTRELVGRVLRAMLVSSFFVAGFGVALSFLVNILDMQFLPRILVDVLGKFLYGARGQEMLVGYGADMGNWYRDGLFRTVSVFFNPMQNAEYTMFFLFLAASQILSGSTLLPRRILGLGTSLLALQLFVSFSRTAYFGAIAGGAGFFALLLIVGIVPRRQVARLVLFGVMVFLAVAPFAGSYVHETILSMGDPRQFSNAGRLIAMAAGVLVWMHHPWFGTGYGNEEGMIFGNLDLSSPNAIESVVHPHFLEMLLLAKADVFGELFDQTNYHSGHIQLLAQLGIVGCIVFWSWHLSWVRTSWKLAVRAKDTTSKALGLGFVGAWGTFFVTRAIDGNTFYPKYGLNIVLVAALCEIAFRLYRKPTDEEIHIP